MSAILLPGRGPGDRMLAALIAIFGFDVPAVAVLIVDRAHPAEAAPLAVALVAAIAAGVRVVLSALGGAR